MELRITIPIAVVIGLLLIASGPFSRDGDADPGGDFRIRVGNGVGAAPFEFSAMPTTSSLSAVNYLDPDGVYFHAAVFASMPPSPEPLRGDSRVITEFTGLLVPRAYDCSNFAEEGAGNLAGFNYFSAVPSRWFPCRELESLLLSNVRRFTPNLPLIDEEYAETAAVYEAALNSRGALNVAELGARWGTWGFRAAAAARRFNPLVREANLFFAEARKDGCNAIRTVADLNGFAPTAAGGHGSSSYRSFSANVDIECGFATPASLIAWAERVKGDIDLVDVDIQGGEATFFTPEVVAVLNSRTRRLVIGTHEMSLDQQMIALFPGWVIREHLPHGAATAVARNCREALRQADKRASTAMIDSLVCRATGHELEPFGPVLQWDGELILDNKKFLGGNG